MDLGDGVRQYISIHALREESDLGSLYSARNMSISIHALREESDLSCRVV